MKVETENEVYTCNRLLFIDDLKLLAKNEEVLIKMMTQTKEFFCDVGLKMNLK